MKRKASLTSQLEAEMFEFTHRCEPCGVTFSGTPGKPHPAAVYLCHRCRGKMVTTVTQIRSEEEARFNVRWTGVFKDPCPDCSTIFGHRVEERPDISEGTHFLICGRCGEELREIEERELSGEKEEETGE